jgi:hypothetical protein
MHFNLMITGAVDNGLFAYMLFGGSDSGYLIPPEEAGGSSAVADCEINTSRQLICNKLNVLVFANSLYSIGSSQLSIYTSNGYIPLTCDIAATSAATLSCDPVGGGSGFYIWGQRLTIQFGDLSSVPPAVPVVLSAHFI